MTAGISTEADGTDLERRVLAQERILHSLIAYMSRTEPRLLEHLAKAVAAPLDMEHRRPDRTEADPAVLAASSSVEEVRGQVAPPLRAAGEGVVPLLPEDRVRTTFRNGIWTVVVDGVFAGDYTEREFAEAAAALERQVPR
ncbi:MAG: hypothetical protein O9292_09615 [Rhodobacteraceae bacterium]|nr:hypothetical protein [Paracoccaceae bacterium]MCZ8336426.1 hypothetical protein [Paracoccaceae bacterium]